MKTAGRILTSSRKPFLRSISREPGELPSINTRGSVGLRNFRKPPQGISPVISQATRNVGLTIYEMLGMAELMRVAYEKGDLASVQNRLAFLITDAEHLTSSIADILALTTLQAEPVKAACERFDIVALLHEVSEAGRSIAGDKPLTVMDVSCASHVMIHSDQAKVKQIMMRLMSNAAKFTDRGRIALILSKDNDEIRLTVADTGRGMAQEQINAVLDSSEHGYDGEMNGFATSGLGLRLVKAVVKQLHGSLSIASKTGEGTIVAVSLPVSEPRKSFQ